MAAKQSRGAGASKPDSTSASTGGPTGGATGVDTTSQAKNERPPSLYVQIADRAYYIWLEKGMPEVGAMDFWFQAEAEVLAERQARSV